MRGIAAAADVSLGSAYYYFQSKEDLVMAFFQMKLDPKLIRASIALVWLYEGLWCKLLGGMPRHAEVIAATPFLGPMTARAALITLGLAEWYRRMGLVWAAKATGGACADCAPRRDETRVERFGRGA